MDIHIFWEGPFTVDTILDLDKDNRDRGVYQIYGHHPLYGDSVLLYIGKTSSQTFSARLQQHDVGLWLCASRDPSSIQFYVGRLAGHKPVSKGDWETMIDQAEKLLIFSHQPCFNISSTQKVPEELKSIHIYNWDSYRSLFPEVNGKTCTYQYEHIVEDKIYTYENIRK